jgi:hypothetical protein
VTVTVTEALELAKFPVAV